MKNLIQAAVVTLFAASTAQAQQAVQWKVSDGGNGHWYQLILASSPATWQDGQNYATQQGGHLATITTHAENLFLATYIQSNIAIPWGAGVDPEGCWLGGRKIGGTWTWCTGEPWSFTGWNQTQCIVGGGNQPDQDGAPELLQIACLSGGECRWDDICIESEVGSCTRPFILLEWSADCNGDEIVDYGQCLDGTLPDYNGNKIPDCCERGEACMVGSYPVEWRVEDGGNGHWYRFVPDTTITWAASRERSILLGGDLATVTSASEQEFLFAMIAAAGSGWSGGWWGPFIGATRRDLPNWQWVSGEPWDYQRWGPGEPNNDSGGSGPEDRLTLLNAGAGGSWNDVTELACAGSSCEYRTSSGFVIEWSADCNNDGIVDYGQCHDGTLPDYNGNNIPDCCEQGEACVVGKYPVQWRSADGGNGHWYLATRPMVPLNWQGSIDACTATGGHLPTLASQAEDNFVMALALGTWFATDTPFSGPFIGGRRSSSQQTSACAGWQWITNEPFNYVAEFPPGDSNGYGPCGSVCQCMSYFYQDEPVLAYWDRSFPVWNSCLESNVSAVLLVEWSADCNNDGIVDYGQILQGELADLNTDGVPDICQQPTCVDADIYRDFNVNGADLGILLSQWGPITPLTESDLNGDGVVDGADLGLLLSFWGGCP